MLKPIGPNVLIKVMKVKSSIELLEGTNVTQDKDLVVTIEEIGTNCSMGVRKGHEVIIGDKMTAVVLEQTDEFDLIIIPESAIKAVRNWNDDDVA